MNTKLLTVLTLSLPLLGGCHAAFKNHVGALGDVQIKTIGAQYPQVNLAGSQNTTVSGPDLVSAVVGVVQATNEANLERRISRVVDAKQVSSALVDSVADNLGDGPPFTAAVGKGAGNILQLDVRRYGLNVGDLGSQGNFDYVVRMRVYNNQANRIYNARVRCEAPIGSPEVAAQVLGVVNNTRQINKMSDQELQAAFDNVATWCGERIVEKLRRHAG